MMYLEGRGSLVCLIPGFGGGPKGYLPFMEALNRGVDGIPGHGNAVLFVPSQRLGALPTAVEYPPILAHQAAEVLRRLSWFNEPAILVGHSMGGAIATVVHAMRPAAIRRSIVLCSACVLPDNPFSLAWRLLKKTLADTREARYITDQQRRDYLRQLRDEGLCYIRDNPWRAIQEGWTLGRFSTCELARRQELETHYVLGAADPLFKLEKMRTALAHVPAERQLVVDCCHDLQRYTGESADVIAALRQHELLSL